VIRVAGLRAAGVGLSAGACAVLLVACSSDSAPPSTGVPSAAPSLAAPTPAASALALPTCPAAPSTGFAWPDEVPEDLPVPPGARLSEAQDRSGGLTVVQFTTPISLRESVLFVIEAMPRAGYTLARGDAENTEADAPFVKGDLRGVLRMIAVEPCRTDWLMAITTGSGAPGGGSPLLPPRPDASPLPFG
jgi:hypothetical protein